MKTLNKILTFTLLVTTLGFATNINKAGTTAANFLKIGVGSRAVGIGGAFVSIADDASSMYWNPGGLPQIKQAELLVNHTRWLADIGYNYLGYAMPVPGMGVFGVNLTMMTMDEMRETDEYTVGFYTGRTFKAGSYAAGISFARQLTDRFGIGINVKYINEYISHSSASGLAMDIGTLFATPFKGIRFGAAISNFGQKLNITGDDLLVMKDIDESREGNNESVNAFLSTSNFDLPLLLRVGLSGEAIDNDVLRLTWAVDGNHPNDNTEYVNLGLELGLLNEMIQIRSGLKSLYMEDGEEEFTLGAGLNLPLQAGLKFQADYAFESFVHLKEIHKFTIRINF